MARISMSDLPFIRFLLSVWVSASWRVRIGWLLATADAPLGSFI